MLVVVGIAVDGVGTSLLGCGLSCTSLGPLLERDGGDATVVGIATCSSIPGTEDELIPLNAMPDAVVVVVVVMAATPVLLMSGCVACGSKGVGAGGNPSLGTDTSSFASWCLADVPEAEAEADDDVDADADGAHREATDRDLDFDTGADADAGTEAGAGAGAGA